MSILSIQSHVTYGYVGNKAAVYPLQAMGYDVWPLNTVQFSNHTGYGAWQGEVHSAETLGKIIEGLETLGLVKQCRAILSGYMGSADICTLVQETAHHFKSQNQDLIYLCDPVIGNDRCYVKPEILAFFRAHLQADILTPNQFEAQILSGIRIIDRETLKQAAAFFHARGVKIVVITGIKFAPNTDALYVMVSEGAQQHLLATQEYPFPSPLNGTGDLFSAVFLGYYLHHLEALLAAQQTTRVMEEVLHHTFIQNQRELQVLSGKYLLDKIDNFPQTTTL